MVSYDLLRDVPQPAQGWPIDLLRDVPNMLNSVPNVLRDVPLDLLSGVSNMLKNVPTDLLSGVSNVLRDAPNMLNDVPNVLRDVPNMLKVVSSMLGTVPPRPAPGCLLHWRGASLPAPGCPQGRCGPPPSPPSAGRSPTACAETRPPAAHLGAEGCAEGSGRQPRRCRGGGESRCRPPQPPAL